MKHKNMFRLRSSQLLILIALMAALVILSFSYAITSAQSGGGYDLTWNTIDGGGGMFSTGGTYSLGGTIGQSDAETMSGSSYTLNGGFWFDPLTRRSILPLIMR